MMHKPFVAQVFWNFKEKKESGCKSQTLVSDNRKENTSEALDRLCDDTDIHYQLYVPYNPEQNINSKRRNRFILEMNRCMMHEKNLPMQLWVELVKIVVYLKNRLPTITLSPFEAWYGYKPSLNFLKIFGCLGFTHVPQVRRDKLTKELFEAFLYKRFFSTPPFI